MRGFEEGCEKVQVRGGGGEKWKEREDEKKVNVVEMGKKLNSTMKLCKGRELIWGDSER